MAATGPRRRGSRLPGPWADLGAAIAVRRRGLGLTQRDLADLADVSFTTVQSLEAGRVSARLSSLQHVLEAVGLALVALPLSNALRLQDDSAVLLRPHTHPDSTTAEHDQAPS